MAYHCYCTRAIDKARCKTAFSAGRLGPCISAPKSMSVEELVNEEFIEMTKEELEEVAKVLEEK